MSPTSVYKCLATSMFALATMFSVAYGLTVVKVEDVYPVEDPPQDQAIDESPAQEPRAERPARKNASATLLVNCSKTLSEANLAALRGSAMSIVNSLAPDDMATAILPRRDAGLSQVVGAAKADAEQKAKIAAKVEALGADAGLPFFEAVARAASAARDGKSDDYASRIFIVTAADADAGISDVRVWARIGEALSADRISVSVVIVGGPAGGISNIAGALCAASRGKMYAFGDGEKLEEYTAVIELEDARTGEQNHRAGGRDRRWMRNGPGGQGGEGRFNRDAPGGQGGEGFRGPRGPGRGQGRGARPEPNAGAPREPRGQRDRGWNADAPGDAAARGAPDDVPAGR